MGNQTSLSLKDGKWKKLEKPTDFFKMDIGQESIIRYVGTKNSEVYEGNLIHIIEVLDDDEEETKKWSGKDLDRWFSHEEISPGSIVRVRRINDKKLPNKPMPLQQYEMELWLEQ